MKNPIVILLTFMLLTGCIEEKNATVNCNLYIRFEEDGKRIKAEADFLKEGEGEGKIPFSPSGGVSFMGSNMENQNLPNGKKRYLYKAAINLPETLRFAWNDQSGKKSKIELQSKSINGFEFDKQGDYYRLQLNTFQLKQNESLVLLFTDSNYEKVNKEVKGPLEDNVILISKNELTGLVSGKASLSIVFTQYSRIQRQDCDCTTTYSYYSATKEIAL